MKFFLFSLLVLTRLAVAAEEKTGAWEDIKTGTMKVVRGASKGIKKAANKLDDKIEENQKEDEAETQAEKKKAKK